MESQIIARPGLRWVNVSQPSPEELNSVAEKYGLHPLFVQDCLEAHHLPKFEKTPEGYFVIVRAFDDKSASDEVATEEMTRKVAIFASGELLLTIHRHRLPFLERLHQSIHQLSEEEPFSPTLILTLLTKEALLSFERPLEAAEYRLDSLESGLFATGPQRENLKDLHIVRQRLNVLKRLFWHSLSVVQRIPPSTALTSYLHDLRETTETLLYFTDELLEDATSLLQLELSLAAQRTNEVVRVLTVFSVFFLPLTFIAGVYGMNFKQMPELEWALGYPMSLFLMLAVTAAIALWFKKKGWLKWD